MQRYVAYGLAIDSEIELPELDENPEAAREADIRVSSGRVQRPPTIDPDSDDYVVIDSETVQFHTPHAGFRIVSGRDLTVDPAPGSSQQSLRLAILGRALGAMLQWQGLFVLHASAVARDGRAIAIAGVSGAGKSTTAAKLLERGWMLVADDLVVIDFGGSAPVIRQGLGHLKLWPDSAAALGLQADDYRRVHALHEKRFIPLDRTKIIPVNPELAMVYVLGESMRTGVEAMRPQEAIVEIVRHSYAPRIMRALGRQHEHFGQCARLVRAIGPRRLLLNRTSSTPTALSALLADGSAQV